MLLNPLFDPGDQQGSLSAVRRLLVTAEADEIRIHGAVTVLRHCDDKAAAAVPAEDAGLEVMRVFALFFAGRVGIEHILNTVPRCFVDERLMATRIANTAIRDFTPVVGRGKNFVQSVVREWSSRRPRSGPCCQSPTLKFGSQPFERPLASRIRDEGPCNERCPIRIHLYGANLAAFLGHSADVAVAEGRPARCTANFGFLLHPLHDFMSQIAAVKLGDRAHDAVQQRAGGCLVNILCG
nr:hypothetical protein CPGR_04079 [Mycolicibacterium malmesburyense]